MTLISYELASSPPAKMIPLHSPVVGSSPATLVVDPLPFALWEFMLLFVLPMCLVSVHTFGILFPSLGGGFCSRDLGILSCMALHHIAISSPIHLPTFIGAIHKTDNWHSYPRITIVFLPTSICMMSSMPLSVASLLRTM